MNSNQTKSIKFLLQSEKNSWAQLPYCSEKLILYLIDCLDENTASFNNQNVQLAQEINEKLILLEERLKREELLKSQPLIDSFKKIKADFKYNSSEQNVSSLKNFLLGIRHLDINELLSMSKTNTEAIDRIKDKNVYLFFGLTGAGKSTTLHFLGGSKLENIDNLIQPVEINNPDFKNVKIGLSAIKSETRLVIPVRIPLDKDEYGCDHAMFCDLPGFGDTNGPEIDISNSIAINECIQNCSGIKPVVFISYKYGDRLQLLTDLVRILDGMFINLEKDVEYFEYVFTKYPDNENISVKDQLKRIKQELEKDRSTNKQIDEPFYVIINNIVKKSKNGLNVLNPIKDEPKKLLDSLLNENFMNLPSRSMSISFSFESTSKLNKQIEVEFEFVEKTIARLANDPTEYELAVFKVKQLVELKKLLKRDDVSQKIKDLSLKLFKNVNYEIGLFLNSFNSKLNRNQALNEADKKQYLDYLSTAKLNDDIFSFFDNKLKSKHAELIENLFERMDSISNGLNQADLVLETEGIQMSLNNLEILKDLLDESHQSERGVYKNSCLRITEKYKTLVDSYAIIIEKSDDFEGISACFVNLKKIYIFLEKFLGGQISSYDELKERVIKKLENCVNKGEKLLIEDDLSAENLTELDNLNNILKLATKCTNLHLHIEKNKLDSIHQKLLDKVREHFNKTKSQMIENTNNCMDKLLNAKTKFKNVGLLFEQLKLMRRNEDFKQITKEDYKEATSKISFVLTKINNELINEIKSESVKINNIISLGELLVSLNWFKDVNEHVYKHEYSDAFENILYFLDSRERKIVEYESSFRERNNIQKICAIVKEFQDLEALIQSYPELKPKINGVMERFLDKLSSELNEIKAFFEKDHQMNVHIDFDYIESSIIFIEIVKSKIPDRKIIEINQLIKNVINQKMSLVKRLIEEMLNLLNCSNEKLELRKLKNCLDVLFKIQEKYPNIQKNFSFKLDSFLNESKTKLDDIYEIHEIEVKRMSLPRDLPLMSKKLNLLGELKRIDQFFNNGKKFYSLYVICFDKYEEGIENCKIESNKLIDEIDFNHKLCSNLNIIKKLEFNDVLSELKRNLNNSVMGLCCKCIKELSNLYEMEESKLETACKNYEQVKLAKEQLKEYLNQDELSEKENKIIILIKELIEKYMNLIKRLMINFAAHDKIENLKKSKKYLDEFIDTNEMTEINEYLNNEEKIAMQNLKNFENKYEIEDYVNHVVSLKDIYSNLEKSKYHDVMIEFKKIVRNKYSLRIKKLDELKNKKPYEFKKGLKKCKSSLAVLPECLLSVIDNLIRDYENNDSHELIEENNGLNNYQIFDENMVKQENKSSLLNTDNGRKIMIPEGYEFYKRIEKDGIYLFIFFIFMYF